MQDEDQARTTLQIALLDLEYIIADLNACVAELGEERRSKVSDAVSQLEAAKRELMNVAYRNRHAGASHLH